MQQKLPELNDEDRIKKGTDIITDEILTSQAYDFFSKLEQKSWIAQQEEAGGSLANQELPSAKMARLQRELAELHEDLT